MPRIVDVSNEVPSVAAAMEIEDDAVWKESSDLTVPEGGIVSCPVSVAWGDLIVSMDESEGGIVFVVCVGWERTTVVL